MNVGGTKLSGPAAAVLHGAPAPAAGLLTAPFAAGSAPVMDVESNAGECDDVSLAASSSSDDPDRRGALAPLMEQKDTNDGDAARRDVKDEARKVSTALELHCILPFA